MTRKPKPETTENEAKMLQAIAAYQKKEYKDISDAAAAFGVPRTTLNHRINGRVSRRVSLQQFQALTPAEERELERWISKLTITGFAPRHALVRQMAESIRECRLHAVNDNAMTCVEYPPLGRDWVTNFLERHPHLKTVVGQTIESSRIQGTLPNVLKKWFDAFHNEVEIDPEVLHENVYNMDESGFSIGTIKAGRVIINASIRSKLQAQPGRQEWVTVVECICADGTMISPLVIFKGETLSTAWVPASVAEDWRFSCNMKGWTSNLHGVEWLRRIFEPNTRAKANGKPRVLICDGHDSHVTGDFIQHCTENNIKLLVLPPHSSHFTQPLDIGIFSPLKEYMTQEISPLVRTNVSQVHKVEWLTAYVRARSRAFSINNITSSWNGAGLVPFYPPKVIRRVQPETPSPSCTPPPTSNPFENALLMSSPFDVPAMQAANTALNQLVAGGEYITTPARDYIRRLTHQTERLRARNTILQEEKTNLEQVVSARKRQASGKRGVLAGHHLVTRPELLEGIRKKELETRERRNKARRKGTKQPAASLQISSREEEEVLEQDETMVDED